MITRTDKKIGAMKLPSMKGRQWDSGVFQEEIKRRQSMSARRTNELRIEKTRKRILRAVYSCLRNGLEPKPENISRIAHISRATAYRHMDFIKGLVEGVTKS
jgi:hypothetical protein